MGRLDLNKATSVKDEEFIFAAVSLIANKLQVVADKEDGDVSLKQWLLLVMITQFENQAPTLTELAEEVGSSRQNVKQLALKLEAKGFLKIEKDTHDGRASRIYICSKCEEYFSHKLGYQEHFLEMLYEGISKEEIAYITKGMYKMLENITKMEALVNGGYKI